MRMLSNIDPTALTEDWSD